MSHHLIRHDISHPILDTPAPATFKSYDARINDMDVKVPIQMYINGVSGR